ncbi:MAG TPA: hypothetical protein VGM88_05915 [Kofleriaceae bacterium]|jgi:hypothetical protein
MALTILTPPAESLAALQPHLAQRKTRLHAAVANGTPSLPMPVYTLGLDAIVAGKGLAGAQHVGWRYIVDQNGTVTAAETRTDGTKHAFASLNQGSFAAETPARVAAAQLLPEVVAGTFELRLLRIPGLNIVALWLASPGADKLVPLAPAPAPLVAGTPIAATDALAQLLPIATKRLAADDRPKA